MHQIANYEIFVLNGHTDLLHRIVLIRFYSYASGGFDFLQNILKWDEKKLIVENL